MSVSHGGKGSSYNTRQTGGITAVFLFSFNDPSAWEETKSRASGLVILGINSLQTRAHAFFLVGTPYVVCFVSYERNATHFYKRGSCTREDRKESK